MMKIFRKYLRILKSIHIFGTKNKGMSNTRGGKGAVASTDASVYLDKLLKESAQQIAQENNLFRFSTQVDFRSNNQTGTIDYILPDGGAFYIGNTLLAVFEAKKQNKLGNAIERWYKNNAFCRSFGNKDVSYITFCSGYVEEDGPLYRILYPFHQGEFGSINKYTKGKNSAFFKEEFTEQEVKDIMQTVLDSILERDE